MKKQVILSRLQIQCNPCKNSDIIFQRLYNTKNKIKNIQNNNKT